MAYEFLKLEQKYSSSENQNPIQDFWSNIMIMMLLEQIKKFQML